MSRHWGRTASLIGCLAATASGQQAAEPTPFAQRMRATIVRLDVNGDQVVERSEVPEAGLDAFDRLLKAGDENKDGKLQIDEIRGLFQKLKDLGETPAERFQAFDRDADGKLARDEYPGPADTFDVVDADKNGSISPAELAAGRPDAPAPAPTTAAALPARFKAMDKDADGKVSREEFTGQAANFARLDRNKDGFLTADEAPGAAPAAAQAIQRFLAMDKDGDGKVSRAEFTGRPAVFELLDADKDASLDKAEIAKFNPAALPQP